GAPEGIVVFDGIGPALAVIAPLAIDAQDHAFLQLVFAINAIIADDFAIGFELHPVDKDTPKPGNRPNAGTRSADASVCDADSTSTDSAGTQYAQSQGGNPQS